MYDYLVVGAGLFGSIFAYEANKRGKKVLVIDKRNHVGGNMYCKNEDGIHVHEYGAHIFHTSNEKVWEYVNTLCQWNPYVNSPIAKYKNEIYNLPFNMNTFHALWGVSTPEEAKAKIAEQVQEAGIVTPRNLEEQAISLVGRDIYEKLIKGYTEKQWGRSCTELPEFIIKRLPVRFTYDNNYFNDKYQAIPVGGYNNIFNTLLSEIDIELNVDFFANRKFYEEKATKVVFTGMIDEYYDYCEGVLNYRSLKFEHELKTTGNFQGNAVVNYNEREVPFTRVIEHKHFDRDCQNEHQTVITKEYPSEWKLGDEPYYPVNDTKNNEMFLKYKERAKQETNVIFGGRLADYKYYDMHHVVEEALKTVEKEFVE